MIYTKNQRDIGEWPSRGGGGRIHTEMETVMPFFRLCFFMVLARSIHFHSDTIVHRSNRFALAPLQNVPISIVSDLRTTHWILLLCLERSANFKIAPFPLC